MGLSPIFFMIKCEYQTTRYPDGRSGPLDPSTGKNIWQLDYV